MKNMKIRLKFIVGFGIITILAVIVGITGGVGMLSLSKADTKMYTNNVLAMDALGSIRENYATQRAIYRSFIIYDSSSEYFLNSINTMNTLENEMETYIEAYRQSITEQEDSDLFNVFVTNYEEGFKSLKEQLKAYGWQNNSADAMALLADEQMIQMSNTISKSLSDCYQYNVDSAKNAVESNSSHANTIISIQIAVLLAACVLSVLLTIYISGLICTPLVTMTNYLKIVAETGKMALRPEDEKNIAKYSTAKDEIGQCVKSVAAFVMRVLEVGEKLETVAGGDFTAELDLLSYNDDIGLSYQKMVKNLNGMFAEINNTTIQMTVGSNQISAGSQGLAQGSTEQATAVEEISTTISELSKKTKENANMAVRASELANTIKHSAEKGSRQMDQMLEAVKEIQDSSKSIGKIIKVIDDIAFRTNILALNAAVEAAKAGQHGKGFAVVAEEVRNLAAKSAEAAKETENLIESSIDKSELGARIAGDTAVSLSEIVVGINSSSLIIEDIARSSEEQAGSIEQVNFGVDQVAQVVQQNSATAQEYASASEEMSEQAQTLEKLMEKFKIKGADNSNPIHIKKKLPKTINLDNNKYL